MAKYRVRFNDRARTGAVAKREDLKKKRQKQFHRDDPETVDLPDSVSSEPQDANAEVLVPLTVLEKEKRKRDLAESLKAQQPESKMSSAKRKRLDKYIDRQVRRQEQDEIFAKLAAKSVDTSKYHSLKTLGVKVDQAPGPTQLADLESGNSDSDLDSDSDSDTGMVESKTSSGAFEKSLSGASKHQETNASTFIDHRPQPGGFGFQNLPTVTKSKKGAKISWKSRLGIESDNEQAEEESESESESDSDNDNESGSEVEGTSDTGSDSEQANAESASEPEDGSEWRGFDENENGNENGNDEDEQPKPVAGTHAKSGKKFVEWAKSLVEVAPRILTPTVESYVHVPRAAEQDQLPRDFAQGTVSRSSTFYVNITRDKTIQESRIQLPAAASEQQIMEAVHNHDVVVLTGETGSGKTTQVPQFLYESGYGHPDSETPGMIGVTQPRRVAAVSTSERVSQELGDHGEKVSYQIRFDKQATKSTRIKFMTDGVLLREMAADLMLANYSAVIVDEAHERSVNTDILIGLLSRVVRLRREEGKPLKLIIMSATLRVADFTENTTLFPVQPPLVTVEARQFPVSIHFNRRTPYDYVQEAVSKTIKIHERLPKGGILIFLTGQGEISQAIKSLKQYASKGKADAAGFADASSEQVRVQNSTDLAVEEETIELDFDDDIEIDEENDADDYQEDSDEEGFEEAYDGEETKLLILPLYTLLPTKEQMKVFEQPPKNTRLCVVATNVAETSLTIPGIRYVVDCGRAKQRVYEHETGVQKFKVSWVSKAAADQRAGRAGRTGPGHCYRLYSSAVYESEFAEFSVPEIARMPIEGLVLQMKAMGVHHIVNFPFPSPPSREGLASGLKLLGYLGALEGKESTLTAMGSQMSLFPLNPRHAKMLLIGNQFGCLPYVVALVSAMSVGDPFVQPWELGLDAPAKKSTANKAKGRKDVAELDDSDSEAEQEEELESVADKEKRHQLRQAYSRSQARFSALDRKSDAFKLLAAVAGYEFSDNKPEFCEENFLRHKIMAEISKLRVQIAHVLAGITRPDAPVSAATALTGKLDVPSAQQIAALKQIITAGYIDNIAVRADTVEDASVPKKTQVIRVPYKTLTPTAEKYVYIHPDSVLAGSGGEPPEFLVYHALTLSDTDNAKLRMRTLVDVNAAALSNLAAGSPLLTYSKPLTGAYAPKQLTPTKREAWVVPRMGAAIGTGGVGWDLPPRKVTQVRVNGDWQVQR